MHQICDLYVKRQPKRHSNKNKIKVQKENEAKKEVLKSDLRLFKFLLHFSVWLREFRDSVQIDIDPVYYINAHLCPTIELCIFFSVLFCRWFIFNSLFVPFAWITIAAIGHIVRTTFHSITCASVWWHPKTRVAHHNWYLVRIGRCGIECPLPFGHVNPMRGKSEYNDTAIHV